ncbi:protein transport protein S31 [Saxophila tyrrhenica]|uniref:Protein transport protein SEC31 n=1 Tax=Saxophila tyrrhenica TaxID=1690608 RepID=A0AAV9PS30_9PEZI|nr:protein transport protein S31 [Saxophila tyrrhenica]
MVGLRTLERTAVFAWSKGSGTPLLATGTKVGAVNDDFSSEVLLELWDLELQKQERDAEPKKLCAITVDSGFNDLAWSEPDDDHPLGVLAGALENGSVDLWDAERARSGSKDAFISRTTKHSGPAKALQWNPYRHNLLASVGSKGEIFIYDLNNMANPFRLGATAARADDIDCLDWNKSEKTAHILATGSSGGSVTVWDVKQKKDVLTLSNQGRKAVSAVAWDPEQSTTLATATSNDQEPLILIWSLRNSSAPERTLRGHELGVLGLSWCQQDSDLLLSCGKDNRTICWNAKTSEKLGDFAAGSNWAFQTRWNPHNPSLIASASFDGKILVTSSQSTNPKKEDQSQANQALDGEDFFAKAQTQPQGITFSLSKAPKWTAKPASVSFGFGGKLVRVGLDPSSKRSKVAIESFAVDTSIGDAAEKFEDKLKGGDMESVCASKIDDAKTDEERADWQVIETLNAGKSRQKLRQYLGFEDDSLSKDTEKLDINGDKGAKPEGSDDDFFGNGEDGDNFLVNLAATKGAKTNNPFSLYTGSESEADKDITQALMLGQFESALDVCLREDRISDAFMIAVCGGQKCIDKAQSAYLRKQAKGPSYLRLLASIVGKNLWDVVHNADLQNWKEVMATLCTYADETEFSDLCEALGDRLEEAYQDGEGEKVRRRDATFCYLAGSKLEKVIGNWIQELREEEQSALAADQEESDFSVHAKCLQGFVEKVSVFRKVTNFKDPDMQASESWRLSELYRLYGEYADILASSGQLAVAESYLSLLPSKYEGAEAAQTRVRQATRKAAPAAVQSRQAPSAQKPGARVQPVMQPSAPAQQPLVNQARNSTPGPYAPPNAPNAQAPYGQPSQPPAPGPYAPASNTYAPAGYQPPQPSNPYGQQPGMYGGYQPPQQTPLPPPPRGSTSSPSVPPAAAAKSMTNWNDMPDNFFKEKATSRRGTPGPQPVSSPFPNATGQIGSPPPPGPPMYGQQQRSASPLPPPPRAGEAPRVTSPPATGFPQQQQQRPSSSAANAYAPPQNYQSQPPTGSTLPTPGPPPIQRGASPYQPPPSTSSAAPSNRYAPVPGSQPSMAPGAPPPQRQVAPNPYAAQQPPSQSPYAPQQAPQFGQPSQGGPPPPPSKSTGPPPQGPPRSQPPTGPPPSGPPRNAVASPTSQQSQLPQTAADQPVASPPPTAAKPKYPRGDRSHIPPSAQPIVDLLSPEIARIKSSAPQQYKPQVDDMEKRLNILFDHLNNEDLLSESTVQEMIGIAQAVSARDWDRALGLFNEMQAAKSATEGTNWMVGVKRLINFGKVSKA